MKNKTYTSDKLFSEVIGIDLGDTKHAVCVTAKCGKITKEYSISNTRSQIEKTAHLVDQNGREGRIKARCPKSDERWEAAPFCQPESGQGLARDQPVNYYSFISLST